MSSRIFGHAPKQRAGAAEQEMQGVNMVKNVRQGIIAKTAYYQCHGAEVHMWTKKRKKKPHKKVSYASSWVEHHCKCEGNWPSQSLIRFTGSYHNEKDRGNAHRSRSKKKMEAEAKREGSYKTVVSSSGLCLSGEDLYHTITTATDDPSAVTAPDNGADTLSAHQPMAGQLLSTAALLEIPKAQSRIMAGRDKLTAIRRQRQRGNSGRVGQHCVCALTWRRKLVSLANAKG